MERLGLEEEKECGQFRERKAGDKELKADFEEGGRGESDRCNGYVNTKYLYRLCYHSILPKKISFFQYLYFDWNYFLLNLAKCIFV